MGVGEKDLQSNYDGGHGGSQTGLSEITFKEFCMAQSGNCREN